MVHTEKTVVDEPAEKQQSIGLASRLLSCLGICLVDCSETFGMSNTWMMRWKSSRIAVFIKYRPNNSSATLYRCYFDLQPPLNSSIIGFLSRVEAFENEDSASFTRWRKNPFFGMSEEQMKIMADLMCEPTERKQEDGQ